MHAGHAPEDIAAMPAWDFLLYMTALPAIRMQDHPFAGADN